ncbi:N-terminal acetyltransferase B complex catalytic subunit NAA20 [Vitis vinifera]|uniref:N-terminal acetyltransferase B complex catalytic subunit NAA20 n=1 Tax=Vitis vinifera TaxID=29760 RepID=A0A438F5K1_VITVI|nr:N-terminal acetyltransferase B complex catalytic subunit NAA20 [Vitis vinifera]
MGFFCRDKAYFVDLFVRASNTPAIKMYEKVIVFSVSCTSELRIEICDLRECTGPFIYEWLPIQPLCTVEMCMLKLGYVIYRRVLRYYSGEEDGLDMRKALSRDVQKKSIIPLKRPITPDELEYD